MVVELRKRYYEVFKPRFFQDNPVTKEEMEVLRRSGQTTTIILPIWDDVHEGYAAENVYLPCKADSWEDAFAPFISPKQKASACVLARYPKIVSAPESLKVYHEADPMNITQTVVGDCSLVSSLIICTHFQKRFPQYNLISGVIFPQDENGTPIVSPKGKYCVKMLVNGITRMVVVDDRIPVSKTLKAPPPPSPTSSTGPTTPPSAEAAPLERCSFLFQPLCTYSRNPSEMWVSILEKAFVKVCGGSYDFPGSNSSVDMFKLSGWLPDGFYFDGDGVDLEVQWKRLSVNHNRGAVLATISTPQNLPKDVEEKLKLVAGHAYAVVSALEDEGGARRLLKIKNPWARQSWEGMYSYRDTNWPSELKSRLAHTEEEYDQGVFWMSWADVCRYFRRCNLSWNPYLLFQPVADNTPKRPRRLAAHGMLGATECFAECPQYHLMARQLVKPARVHLVLARHVLDLVKEYENRPDSAEDDAPLIAVHVYDVSSSPTVAQLAAGRQGSYLPLCDGQSCMARLISNGGELVGGEDACRIHRGVYKNVEAQTISFNCPAGDRDLVLVVVQHKGKRTLRFPFSLFLHTDVLAGDGASAGPSISMHKIPPPQPQEGAEVLRSVIQGAWKAGQSCGGKSDTQTFVYNPQYELVLSAPSHLTIRLNAAENKEAISVQVVRKRPPKQPRSGVPQVSWGCRVDNIHPRTCDVVLQSPMYFHTAAIVDTALQACLAFDATSSLKPAPPSASPPSPPSSPPPARSVGPVVVHLPKCAVTGSFELSSALPRLPVGPLILVAALAESVLVSPAVSKIVHAGAEVPLKSPPPALLQSYDLSKPFVLLSNADALQRTQPLQAVIVELYSIAKALVTLVGLVATSPGDVASHKKEGLRISEVASQLLIKLDNVPCATDDMRQTRRAVVVACHEVHSLVDALAAAASPTSAESTSDAVPVPPAVAPLNPLPAGSYTVVVSTWKKSSPSLFSLWVESTAPHRIREIPAEGAGFRPVIIQTQLRGVLPPAPDALALSNVTLPVSDALFTQQASLTVTTGKASCVFTGRVMTVEANPQQGPSSVAIAAAVFSVSGNSESVGNRVAQLMFVSPFTNSSVCIEPTLLSPQQQYIVVLLSSVASSLPLAVRCFGSSDFSARVNN